MHKLFVVAATLGLVAACKGKPDIGSAPSATAAATSSLAAGSGSAGSGATGAAGSGAVGSGSAGSGAAGSGAAGSDAAESPSGAVALPSTEATGSGWKVKAGFGDSASVFDPTAATFETLGVEVVDDNDASLFRKIGFAAIAPGVKPPTECEELRAVASAETWGEAGGARVSLFCVNGEDDKVATETAILLEIRSATSGAIAIVWAGNADEDRDEMDTCFTSHHVAFSIHGKTLTQRITDSVERKPGAPRTCKAKKRRSTSKETIQRPD